MGQFSGHTLRLPNTGSNFIDAQVKPKNRFMQKTPCRDYCDDNRWRYSTLSNWKFRYVGRQAS